ncbi:PIG-L deacetylase family protein [Deinococcus sp. PESE-13]
MTPLDPLALSGPLWVVAPHPDDEALGCGALLAALAEAGREVWALLLTDGGFSHPASKTYPRPRLSAARLAEWREGLSVLGVPPARTVALGLPDGALGKHLTAAARAQVQQAFAQARPGTVLLPWERDPHPDHRAAWHLLRGVLPSDTLALEYAVWLPERGADADWPRPDEVEELTFAVGDWRDAKARAIAAHRTQLGLIADDRDGFVLAPAMVERALAGPERYFRRLDGGAS